MIWFFVLWAENVNFVQCADHLQAQWLNSLSDD